jgi:glutaminase
MELDVSAVPYSVATGAPPESEVVDEAIQVAYDRSVDIDEGNVADYIPVLADVDPELFGVCVVEIDGSVHGIGDVDHPFSIQSISKAFVWALACEEVGPDKLLDVIGVNNTGLAFDSVMAIELNDGHPMNPMANAGAMASTALMPGETADDQWAFLLDGFSRFAGRPLELDRRVYESESAHNQRNQGIALLLESYGRIGSAPLDVVDVYTKQCSLLVTATDLAVMGATLAHGGVNPITGIQVVSEQVCHDTLAVLAASGLYQRSDEWLFNIGLPGKSGVTGGIMTVAPGKGGIATFSPRLDGVGNSVRGQRATAYLSRRLGLDLFASSSRNHSNDRAAE